MSSRSLRACLVCAVIQPQTKFANSGCPNCEDFLGMRGSTERVQECTSQVFEGTITLNGLEGSWVARYQRLEGYQPGVYAVKVVGILDENDIAAAKSAGVNYFPRDGTDPTEEE